MPWARIATPALFLCKRLWQKLVAHTRKRSRHPASTTASHGTRSPLAANKSLAAHTPLAVHTPPPVHTPLAASTPLAVQTPLAQRAIEQVLLSDDILFWETLMLLALDWLEVDGGHGMVPPCARSGRVAGRLWGGISRLG